MSYWAVLATLGIAEKPGERSGLVGEFAGGSRLCGFQIISEVDGQAGCSGAQVSGLGGRATDLPQEIETGPSP